MTFNSVVDDAPSLDIDAAAAKSAAGAFQSQDVGVVDDPVDHRGGDSLVTDDASPVPEGRLLVKIREACSWPDKSWKNRFAAFCSFGR